MAGRCSLSEIVCLGIKRSATHTPASKPPKAKLTRQTMRVLRRRSAQAPMAYGNGVADSLGPVVISVC